MKKTKLYVKDLCIGMYVAELDRPWLETSFRFQGFRIETEKQLQKVRDTCEYVYIDEDKSDRASLLSFSKPAGETAAGGKLFSAITGNQSYTPSYSKAFEEEFPVAREIYEVSRSKLKSLFDNYRLRQEIDVEQIGAIVNNVMDSVTRNPDALLLMSNLKSKSQDTVRHSINVSILSLVFGRFLGFDDKRLSVLGFSALLHDIGEICVPNEILSKHNRGLTPEERKVLELHTQKGAEILSKNALIPKSAVEVAYSHHERVDGKGYPRGLKGTELSLTSKLVAIIDVYESVTNNPGSKIQISSSDALRSIYSMRETFFDGELVEKFIKCLGIYPVGSVVELNTGEVGIVISLKPDKHLLPTLMIVRNKDGKPCYPPHVINLDYFKTEEGLPKYFITDVLEPNAFGIDLSDFIVRERGFL